MTKNRFSSFSTPQNRTVDFRGEPKVAVWEKTLRKEGCAIEAVKPLFLVYKKNNELLFALCEADATDPQGNRMPPYIFIRGHACIVVPLVRNSDTGEEFYCMIRQRRIGNGMATLEFPAGMLDRNVATVRDVAVRELFEETGLAISPDQLHELHNGPLYSSPGASDEGIYYFGCTLSLPDNQFNALNGRNTGCAEDGEIIRVVLCSGETIEAETTSLQVRLGLFLFSEYHKKA
jgi:ADP-sugar diphosphatase